MNLDKLKDPIFPWQKIEDFTLPTTTWAAEWVLFLISGVYEDYPTTYFFGLARYNADDPDDTHWLIEHDNYPTRIIPHKIMHVNTPEKLAQQLRKHDAALKIAVEAINKTLAENGHLADGDVCTLIDLKNSLKQIEEVLK
jgi:hypothetical protein